MPVRATCTFQAWDSPTATGFVPGQIVEFERDSPIGIRLASMKFGGRYVFEFDRNETRTNQGVTVEKDYSCKECGKKCKTLSELGRHTNAEHRGRVADKVESEDVEIQRETKPVRCKPCDLSFPTRAELMAHKREAHGQAGFPKRNIAETVPVPA